MNERALGFATRLTREDVAGVIEALIDGLKDGRLKVHKSNDVLELEVPRVIDLEVEAGVRDERATFSIEVSWRTNRAENPDAPEGPYAPGTGDYGNTTFFSGKSAAKGGALQARTKAPVKKRVPSATKSGGSGRSTKK
ncbi:MAG: amphi-Trp domain-containing protein [Desulfovibrio sp.]|jgi:amphi-Trp domain-containing protein|nr:amphi-Trp domain-containing protein [Desulfovibrio sp.]